MPAPGFANAFFKKKGFIESLFKFGMGDAEGEERPVPVSDAEAQVRHEVFSVRGRPFIASVQGRSPRRKSAAQSAGASADASPALAPAVAMSPRGEVPQSPQHSQRGPKLAEPIHSTTKSVPKSPGVSHATSQEEVERAALFRNNLLRSCWKPGLKNEEVQRILTLYEHRLMDAMHRWMNEELWDGFRIWKRRTWKLDRLRFILSRAKNHLERKAIAIWISYARVMKVQPFNDRMRMRRSCRSWRKWAKWHKMVASLLLKSPFEQLRLRARARQQLIAVLQKGAVGFLRSSELRGFNSWREYLVFLVEARQLMAQLIAGMKGGLRRAFNTWHTQLRIKRDARRHAAKLLMDSRYAYWHRWEKHVVNKHMRAAALMHSHILGVGWAFAGFKKLWQRISLMRAMAARTWRRKEWAAFATWSSRAIVDHRQLLKLRSAVAALSGSKLHRVLNSLRQHAVERRGFKLRVRAAARSLIRHPKARAFRSWRAAARNVKLARYAALSGIYREVALAFHSWSGRYGERGLHKRKLAIALSALRAKGVRKAWGTWLQSLPKLRRLRDAMCRILQGREVLALNAWQAHVAAVRLSRAMQERALAWRAGGKQAMAKWMAYIDLRRQLRAMGGSLRNKPLRFATNKWIERAEEELEIKKKLERALVDLAIGGARSGWIQWLRQTKRERLMARGVARMVKKESSRGFEAWRERSLQLVEQAGRLNKALSALSPSGRAKRKVLNTWRVPNPMLSAAASFAASALKRGFNSFRSFLHEQEGQLMLLERAAKRLSQRSKARAFSCWADQSGSLSSIHSAAHAAALRLTQRQLSCAWNSWLHKNSWLLTLHLATANIRNHKLRQGLNTLTANALDAAINSTARKAAWALFTRHLRQAWLSWGSAAQQLALMKCAGSHLRHRCVAHTWRQWQSCTSAAQRSGELMLQAALSMRNHGFQCAWRHWTERAAQPDVRMMAVERWRHAAAAHALLCFARHAETMARLRHSVEGLCKGQVQRVINTWRHGIDEHLERQAQVEAALLRMRSGACRAFISWKAKLSGAAPDPLLCAVQYLREHRIPRAWRSWLDFARERSVLVRAAHAVMGLDHKYAFLHWRRGASAALAKQGRIGALISTIISPEFRAARRALRSWEAMRAARLLMRRAGFSFFGRRARACFSRWLHFNAGRGALAAKAAEAALRLTPTGRAKGKALISWLSYSEQRRQARRAASFFFSTSTHKALNKWVEVASHEQLLLHSLRHMVSAQLSRAFRNWRHAPHKLAAPARRWALKPLVAALNKWIDECDAAQQGARATLHFARRHQRRALHSWIEWGTEHALLQIALGGLRAGSLKRGFNSWHDATVEAFEDGDRRERALAAMARGAEKKCLNTWAALLGKVADPMGAALAQWRSLELKHVLLTWVEATALWLVMHNAICALMHRHLLQGLNTWRAYLGQRQLQEQQMRILASVADPAARALRKGFRSWACLLEAVAKARLALGHLTMRCELGALRRWCQAHEEALQMKTALVRARRPEARALVTWALAADYEARRLQKLTSRVLKALTSAEFRAFRSWRRGAEHLEQMAQAMRRIRCAKELRALNSWHDWAHEAAEWGLKMERARDTLSPARRDLRGALNALAEAARRARSMRSALSAIQQGHAKRALNSWRHGASECGADRERMKAALLALSPERRSQQRAFNSLKDALQMRQLMLRAAARVLYRHAARALHLWQDFVDQTHCIYQALACMRLAREARAFKTWVKAPPHPAERTLSRLSQRTRSLSRALNLWLELAANWGVMRTGITHMIHARLSLGLRTWQFWSLELSLMQRAAQGLRNAALRRGLNHWIVALTEGMQDVSLQERALRAMALSSWQRYFNAWAAMLRAGPSPLERALGYFSERSLRIGWSSWLAYDGLLTMQLNALKRMRQSELLRGMRSWQLWSEQHAAWQHDMSAVLSRLGNPALTKAFVTWAHLSEHLTGMRQLAARVFMRQERAALDTWEQRSTELRCMRRAASNMRRGAVAKAMRAWLQLVSAQGEALALRRKALGGWSPLGGSFRLWVRLVANLRPLLIAATHWSSMRLLAALSAWEAACAARHRMRGALASLFNRQARVGFEGWRHFAAERMAAHAALAAALHKLSPEGRAMGRALASWKVALEERRLMRKAAAGFMHGAFARAMRVWTCVVEERERALGLVRRAMAGQLRIAFTTWLHTPKQSSEQGPGEKAARRMVARSMAKAFDTWGEMTCIRRLELRALSHLTRRCERSALASWREALGARALMARSVAAFSNHALLAALNSLHAASEQRKLFSERVRTFLVSHRTGVRKAFNAWRECKERALLERAAACFGDVGLRKGWRSWLEAAAKAEQARRALAHFAGHYLVKGWSYWEAYAETRRLLLRGGVALRSLALRKAFSSWSTVFVEDQHQLRRMAALVSGFQGRKRACLNSWIGFFHDRQRQQKVARHLLSIAGRALRIWKGFAYERARARSKMRRAVLAPATGTAKGFNRWSAFVAERQMLQRAAAPFRHGGLLRGMNSWHEWCEEHARMSSLIGAFRGEHDRRRGVLLTWRDMLSALQPAQEAVGLWRSTALSRAWFAWCEHLVVLVRLHTGLVHLANHQAASALYTWMGLMARLAITAHALDLLRTREIRRALRRWARSAEDREEKIRIMRSKVRVLSGDRRTMRALNSWKFNHQIESLIRAELRTMRGRQVRAALNSWKHEVSACRELRPFSTLSFTQLVQQRQAFKCWQQDRQRMRKMARCTAFWKDGSLARALNTWTAMRAKWRIAKAAMMRLIHRNLTRGLNSWAGYVRWLRRVRAAAQVFLNRSLVKAARTWQAHASEGVTMLTTMRTAAEVLLGMHVKHALNLWRAEAAALEPLRRTATQWAKRPISKALRKLRSYNEEIAHLRGIIARIRFARLGDAFDEWVAIFTGIVNLSRAEQIATKALYCPLERKALNTWLLRVAEEMQRRRLAAAFMGNLKRFFSRWLEFQRLNSWAVRKCFVKPSKNFKVIQLMTWREVCEWLNSIDIYVSRSPPTLLSALRDGFVYQDLIRKASPYYYVRHNIASSQSRGIFLKVQKFFDSRFVINMVGATKMDITALRDGKAKVHLELIQAFRTVIEATNRMPEGPLFDPLVGSKEKSPKAKWS